MTARLLLAALLVIAALPGAAHAVTPTNSIANAPSITGAGPHAVTYDTDGATTEAGEPTHWTQDYGSSVWVRWTPSATVNMRMDNCGPHASTGTKVRIYKGPASSVTFAKLSTMSDVPGTGEIPYTACETGIQTVKAQAGQTYYLAIVRSKYMQTSDPGGTLYVEQSTAKPTVSFKAPATQFGPKAKIEFSSPGAVSFSCTLDGEPWSCGINGDNGWFQGGFSDHVTHTLTVVAKNQFLTSGNGHSWSFNADGLGPETVIDSPAPTTLGQYDVKFHAAEAGATFTCQLVNEMQPVPCTSPWTLAKPSLGGHTVRVVAYDKWGNADKTPADQSFHLTAPPTQVQQVEPPQPPVRQPSVQQPPVQQQQTPPWPPVQTQPPAGPCAAKARGGRLTRRGMRVTITGDRVRACTVTVELRAGRRVLTRQVRTVDAGGALTVVLKPRVKAPKGSRVRLVAVAR